MRSTEIDNTAEIEHCTTKHFDRVFNIRNRSNVLLSDSAAYPTITHNDVIVSLGRRCTSLTVKLDELEVAPASQRETFIQ